MTKEYSPFTPGMPVPPEFFVGRENEIKQMIESIAKSAEMKSLERIFVLGERGIGKSSLCRLAMAIGEDRHQILGIHVFLGGVTSLEEMVRRIFERLLQESREKIWFQNVRDFLGNHIKEVGLFGVSLQFEASKQDLAKAVSDFAPVLRNLLERLGSQKKGFMLVLDDLNGLATEPRFAHWLKSTIDEIATSRASLPLTLVLVGLPERRRQLIESQPSLDRIFSLINIDRFNEKQTIQFYEKAFGKVNVKVEKDAMQLLWRFSGGYPAFLHEIGDAVFKVDKDGSIDKEDATQGVMLAAQVIGVKYIEPKVLDAIKSDRYRGILRKIADPPQILFSKDELRKRLSQTEVKVLDNFLQKMKQLGVLRQPPEAERGIYEFVSELYPVFFWLQSIRKH
jgi:AAA+ ATPase superfamily predicted ATPase